MSKSATRPVQRVVQALSYPGEGLAIGIVGLVVIALVGLWLSAVRSDVTMSSFTSLAVLRNTLGLSLIPAVVATVVAYVISYVAIYSAPRFQRLVLIPLASIFVISHYVLVRAISIWVVENGLVHSFLRLWQEDGLVWPSGDAADLVTYWLTAWWRYVPLSALFFCLSFAASGDSLVSVARNLRIGRIGRHWLVFRSAGVAPCVLSIVLVVVLLGLDTVSPAVLLDGRWPTFGTVLADTAGVMQTWHHSAAIALAAVCVSASVIFVGIRLLGKNQDKARFPDLRALNPGGNSRGVYGVVGALFIAVMGLIAIGLTAQALNVRPRAGGIFSVDRATDVISFEGISGLLDDSALGRAAIRSALVAGCSALVAVVAGSISAFREFARSGGSFGNGRQAFRYTLLIVPLFLPQATMGHAAVFLAEKGLMPDADVWRTIWLVVGHAGLFVAIPFFAVRIALAKAGPNLVMAAENMGVSSTRAIGACWRMWLPAACAAFLAVACLSGNEIVMAQHVLVRSDAAAVVLESRRYGGLEAVDFVASLVLVAITVLCLMGSQWVFRRIR